VAEERVIQLLEEIRDLQKLHVENYKDALKNQQESIELQKRAVRRQKITLVVFGLLLVALLIFSILSSHSATGQPSSAHGISPGIAGGPRNDNRGVTINSLPFCC
jgi:hypothetical protein